jgi:hypothetical protein
MKKDIQNDYVEFLNVSIVSPPDDVSQKILAHVRHDLRFSPTTILVKLGAIHTFTTAFVLYVCPQFGVSWGAPSYTLLDVFMRLGHEACAALCGVTLIGMTFLMAAMLLKPQESFWLKQQMPWVPISLSFVTLILLAAMGAKGHHSEYMWWSLFAIVSGWAFFELGRKGRVYGFRVITRLVA